MKDDGNLATQTVRSSFWSKRISQYLHGQIMWPGGGEGGAWWKKWQILPMQQANAKIRMSGKPRGGIRISDLF